MPSSTRTFYGWPPTLVYAQTPDSSYAHERSGHPLYAVPGPRDSRQYHHSPPEYLERPLISNPTYRRPSQYSENYHSHPRAETVMSSPPFDLRVPVNATSPHHTGAHASLSSPSEPMAFRCATRKLDATLHKATTYFNSFYLDFKKETRGLGYASDELIRDIWKSKISFAERNPAAAAANAVERSGINDGNNAQGAHRRNNSHRNNRNKNPQDQDSNTRRSATELFSFKELLRDVQYHCEAVIGSTIPPKARSDEEDEEDHATHLPRRSTSPVDEANKLSDDQIDLARILQKKVARCRKDLYPHIEKMMEKSTEVKKAVDEMRVLLQALETYKAAWKEGCGVDDEEADDGYDDEYGS